MKPPPAIPAEILNRKGAPTTRAVPACVRTLLDAGELETANLCEWLVLDQARLAAVVFPRHGWAGLLPPLADRFNALANPTALRRARAVGALLAERLPGARAFSRALAGLRAERSDVARNWACFLVGTRAGLPLDRRLRHLRPLAADPNMSVRETAWLAVRDALAAELPHALGLLAAWALEPEAGLRRFASEATRPRGVWCRHLDALKADPAPGLRILEPLKSDPSKYVRDSVANWLNDASKSQPAWVRAVTARWQRESATPETAYIVRRALRTLSK